MLKWIEYGQYGGLIIIYPKPYSIYLRGTVNPKLLESRLGIRVWIWGLGH